MAEVGKVSSKAQALPRSAIRQIMKLASELQDVVHLEVGEPSEATPAPITQSALASGLAGGTKYLPNSGGMRLRQLIAERAGARTRSHVEPERVVVTTGAIGALFTTMAASLDEGDEVLLPDPGWPNYSAIAVLTGACAKTYSLAPHRGFEPDIEEIGSLITPATRAILVNSPSNPTGAVFSKATIRAISDLAVRHNIYLISDEIYEDMVFGSEHHSFLSEGIVDRLWVVSGFSKSFAMTGWRIGWLIAPPHAVEAAIALQEPVVSCVSAISHAAAVSALSEHAEYAQTLASRYRKRRDILVSELRSTGMIPMIPQGAFYALLDIAEFNLPSFDAALEILTDYRVAVVPGVTFGPKSDRYLRLAFTTDEDRLREGCRRLRRWIDARRGLSS
jgi:aspartate/methionine/tyrosine aminotransferase